MADPRLSRQNGVTKEHLKASQLPGQRSAFSRPFTLYEALPYTPFTSIIPFNSGNSPTPQPPPRDNLSAS